MLRSRWFRKPARELAETRAANEREKEQELSAVLTFFFIPEWFVEGRFLAPNVLALPLWDLTSENDAAVVLTPYN
jgi:hypothetical protein